MNSEGKQSLFQWSSRRSAGDDRLRYRPTARINQVLFGLIPWINVVVLMLAVVVALGSHLVVPGIPVGIPRGTFHDGISTDLVLVVVPDASQRNVTGVQDVQVFFQNERYRVSIPGHVQQFQQRLSEVLARRSNKDALLYVDAAVAQSSLARVVDVLRNTGLERVNIVTKP